MGTWSYSGGSWLLSGSASASFLSVDRPMSQATSLIGRVADAATEVQFMLLASGDGRSGFAVGIFGSNVQIRRRTFGTMAGSAVTNGASDLPISAACSVAHGVAAGNPIELDARWIDGTLQLYVNGVLVLRHTPGPTDAYRSYRRCGFLSAVPGARVSGPPQLCALVANYAQAGESLVMVCDNNVFVSNDGISRQQIGASVFSHGDTVSMDYLLGRIYAVGGGSGVVIDPGDGTVTPMVPTAGALPGATPGLPGSTTATVVARFLNHLVYAAGTVVTISAADDALDLDTGSLDEGRAVAFNVGQNVVGMREIANGNLIIGTTDGIWRLIGDGSSLGGILLRQISIGLGITGKDAIWPLENGMGIAHTFDGLVLIPPDGNVVPFSSAVLSKGLTIPRASTPGYVTQVIRDYRRHHLHTFLVPRGGDPGTGPYQDWYDTVYAERIGGFAPQRPGYFPVRLPYRLGPVASCVFRGELYLGSRDGYVWTFDDAATTFDGATINDLVTCSLISLPEVGRVSMVSDPMLTLGVTSGAAKLRIVGGRTPEEAFVGAKRAALTPWMTTLPADADRPHPIKVSSPAMVAEVKGATAGVRMRFERLALQAGRAPGMVGPPLVAAAAPPAPCAPPVAAETVPDFEEGGGMGNMLYIELLLTDNGGTPTLEATPPDEPGFIPAETPDIPIESYPTHTDYDPDSNQT